MDPITWDLTSPQLPREPDYSKSAVPTSWTEKTSAQRTVLSIPCLTVVIASCGLIGNNIIICLLGFQIKRSSFIIYILNISTADFFFLFCQIMNIMGKLIFSLNSDTVFLILAESCASVSENLLVAMSLEHCLLVTCSICYPRICQQSASVIVCFLIWFLTVLFSGASYFICEYSSSYNGCEEFMRSSCLWQLLLSLLYFLSLTLLIYIQCRRHHFPKSSNLWILLLLISFHLLLYSLPFIISLFNRESEIGILKQESDVNLILCESDTEIFETEDDIDVFLSCLENSINPFTYFCISCCKKRRGRESLGMLLQRTILEEELEVETELVYGSSGDVTLTQWTQDRTLEEPMRGDTVP